MGDGRFRNRPYEEFRNPALRHERIRREEAERQIKIAAEREKHAHETFINRVELASKHHPEIKQEVFRDVIKAYEAEHDNFCKKEKEIREKGEPDVLARLDMQKLRNDFMAKVQKRLEHHGPAATEALHALHQENQPESMFTPLVRMFYNTDRGGMQWGGTLGAFLAGGMAYLLGSSSGSSSLLITGLTAAVALVGAYAGSQMLPGKETTPTPNFRTPAPTKEPAKAQEATVPETENEKSQATEMPIVPTPIKGVSNIPMNDVNTTGYTPKSTATSPDPASPDR